MWAQEGIPGAVSPNYRTLSASLDPQVSPLGFFFLNLYFLASDSCMYVQHPSRKASPLLRKLRSDQVSLVYLLGFLLFCFVFKLQTIESGNQSRVLGLQTPVVLR